MFVLTEIVANNVSAYVGNIHVSNNVEELQKIMNADFDHDLKEANNFWMDCGSNLNDKPLSICHAYSARIKTLKEFKSWSIMKVQGEVTQS